MSCPCPCCIQEMRTGCGVSRNCHICSGGRALVTVLEQLIALFSVLQAHIVKVGQVVARGRAGSEKIRLYNPVNSAPREYVTSSHEAQNTDKVSSVCQHV